MTGLAALWLPILVSSVLVFVVSSAIHMASPWHKSDYPKLPNEGRVMDALRPLAIPAGDYMMPRASSRQEMRSPEFAEKMKKGPVMMLTVWPGGSMAMGTQLVQWFLYSIVVGCFAGYVAGRALPAPSSGTCSAWPASRRSWDMPSRSGRCRSGTVAPGPRRSRRASTE